VQPAITLSVAIDEDAVRRLCGPAVFAQADALQRAGHVLGPKIGENILRSDVRGTWNRIDEVVIQVQAGRFHPECTRDGAIFCRHVGALLLQWVRNPAAFAEILPNNETGTAAAYPGLMPEAFDDDSIIPELEQLLERETVPRMRDIANRRGIRGIGSKKTEVIHNLAIALAKPASIDAALASLSESERLALDAVHLASAKSPVHAPAAGTALHALGGRGKAPLDTLWQHGLILSPNHDSYNEDAYLLPRAVAARLTPLDTLARPVNAPKGAGESGWMGIMELMQFIALASQAAPFAIHADSAERSLGNYGPAPTGFIVNQEDAAVLQAQINQRNYQAYHQGVRLKPRTLLSDAALDALTARTGQPREAIDFVMRLMMALDIAQATPRVVVHSDRLHALLSLEPAFRMAILTQLWLTSAGLPELSALVRAEDRLQIRWRPAYAASQDTLVATTSALVRLTLRLVGRITPGRWFDLRSFIDTIERFAPAAVPTLGQQHAYLGYSQGLALDRLTKRGEAQPLVLTTQEGLTHVLSRLIAMLIGGPLRWLGLVDAVIHQDRIGAFRVRPIASALTGREFVEETPERESFLSFDDDLTIRVPPRMADVSIHGLLASTGELVEAAADGLRYRLTATGMQELFDAGTTGPEFTKFLTERAGGELPLPVRAAIDRWWREYGAIRLYDELTLIELGDDVLLKELRAVTTLNSALMYAFSPRLIAIDPTRADAVVAELTARGYTPRLVEEG
jgi:hypothetical protein